MVSDLRLARIVSNWQLKFFELWEPWIEGAIGMMAISPHLWGFWSLTMFFLTCIWRWCFYLVYTIHISLFICVHIFMFIEHYRAAIQPPRHTLIALISSDLERSWWTLGVSQVLMALVLARAVASSSSQVWGQTTMNHWDVGPPSRQPLEVGL